MINVSDVQFYLVPEYLLSKDESNQLSKLLELCFPDTFDGRIYFKQRPHFRMLARLEKSIIGQVGVDFRVVRVGDACLDIFGIIDLCVDTHFRGLGIGSRMIDEVEQIAAAGNVSAMIAFADRFDLYVSRGFKKLDVAKCRFMAVDDLRTHSVLEREMADCLIIKDLIGNDWKSINIDLLGYLF